MERRGRDIAVREADMARHGSLVRRGLGPGLLVVILTALGCASVKDIPAVDGPVAAAAESSGASIASVSHGHDLYVHNCNRCHPYKLPASRSKEEWAGILPRMTKRAGLNELEAADVRAFVFAARDASEREQTK
jgi:cytochrome c5